MQTLLAYDLTSTSGSTAVGLTGVIAQEVQAVLPEAVSGDDILGVSYGNMVGILVEAIKELNAKVESLTLELKILKECK